MAELGETAAAPETLFKLGGGDVAAAAEPNLSDRIRE